LSSNETTTAGPTGAKPDNGKTQEAAQVAQEKAQDAKRAAGDRVRSEVDTRSTQAGEQAETVAQDVRSVGEHLRSEGKEKPAELADRAAERVAEIGDYLKRSDGDRILRDVERLGREKPWAVMAGGIALGIAASRFLKASSSRRYQGLESSSNLPARRTDVDRAAIGPAAGSPADATPSPVPASPPAPGVRSPVPGAPEREFTLSGGVVPERPVGAGE
jgi:hypothetical protein